MEIGVVFLESRRTNRGPPNPAALSKGRQSSNLPVVSGLSLARSASRLTGPAPTGGTRPTRFQSLVFSQQRGSPLTEQLPRSCPLSAIFRRRFLWAGYSLLGSRTTRRHGRPKPHWLRHQRVQGRGQSAICLGKERSLGSKVRSKLYPWWVWIVRDPNDFCSEAWRYTGPFSRWNRFKRLFPGLGTATVLFAGYCVYEQLFLKDSHGHKEDHH